MSHLPSTIKTASYFPVTIHIAGDIERAKVVCQRYCDEAGLCVTVRAASYIYSGGSEEGVQVGLINYPRFPKKPSDIRLQAIGLAYQLRHELGQESFTVEDPHATTWFSWRAEDRKQNA